MLRESIFKDALFVRLEPRVERLARLGLERIFGEFGGLHRWRQVVAVHAIVGRRQHRSFHAVLKLAHVARPRIRLHHVDGGRRYARHLLAVPRADPRQEALRQRDDVAAALRQVRHRNRKHRKPVVEVFAEELLHHELLKVAARRRDEADVAPDLSVGPDAAERALLKDPEQLHLHRYRQIADLVQKERSAVRSLGASYAALARVGESALLVSEKLRLDERLRERRAVQHDERLVLPRRKPLNRPRDKLLARAARAADENGRLARRDLPYLTKLWQGEYNISVRSVTSFF